MPDPIVLAVVAAVVVLGVAGLVLRRRALPPGHEAPALDETSETPPQPQDEAPSQTPEPAATPAVAPSVEAGDDEAPLPRHLARRSEVVDGPGATSRDQTELDAISRRRSEKDRVRAGLAKTRSGFVARLGNLFRGAPKVDQDLKDEIEEVLFTADIGTQTADALMTRVSEVLDRKAVADEDAVWKVIRAAALEIVDVDAPPLSFEPAEGPYVLLMIGVNGVGKTTTLGKLAARHVQEGRKTLVVAGDTFRAAAGEQLEVWAKRVGCDIHAGASGADPSSVIYDGIRRGVDEGYDVVLCDTAGRLHTRSELMDELRKIGRSAGKALSKDLATPREVDDIFLVLDATIGQNALAQAALFKETMAFTGIVLTKLDGTAKGGVVLGVCQELGVPVRYIGIGEGVDDLRRFDAIAFVDALFGDPAA